MSDIEFRVTELERKMANVVRDGTIFQVDTANARVKVQTGKNQTAWLPWFANRAGDDRDWHAPSLGEQVVIFSPDGNLAMGRVMPALYQNAHPAPSNDAGVRLTQYSDGGFVQINKLTGAMHIKMMSKIKLEAPEIELLADIIMQKAEDITLEADSDITIDATGVVDIDGSQIDLN